MTSKVFFHTILFLVLAGCSSVSVSRYKYTELDSGLKYAIIKEGRGENPKRGDIVTIHYVARFEDGKVFERSRDGKGPVSVRLGSNQLIKGLQDGILLMNIGSQYRFSIPAELAYGEHGFGVVEPNTDLVYNVELLDSKPGLNLAKKQKEEVERNKTPSGLVYAIFEKGKGTRAFPGMLIKAEYSGFMNDSIMFDSSYDRGKPLTARIGDGTIIRGLEEGLTYLHEGDKARFWIPAELSYGKKGRGIIPPDADLIFDIELIEVKEAIRPETFDVSDKDTITTESGLMYIVVEQGYGAKPEPGQIVELHYSAYLTNGFLFDSSVQREQPFSIVVGKDLMIRGWDEGILLMRRKAKYRFILPPHLAFGKRSFGDVPRFSTIIFDIELIDIK